MLCLLSGLLGSLESQLVYHLDGDLGEQVPVLFNQVLDHSVQTLLDGHVYLNCLRFWQYLLQVYCEVIRVGLDEALLERF